MKIKKTDEEQTYISKTTEHTFDVDGKVITVSVHTMDGVDGSNDYDREIIEGDDYKSLTEVEQEVLGEELDALVDMKVSEELEVDTSV